jgi:hypothetical protein
LPKAIEDRCPGFCLPVDRLRDAHEPSSHIRMNESRPELPGSDPLLPWLIFTGVSLFALVLLWYFGLIERMVASDHTYIRRSSCCSMSRQPALLWRILIVSRKRRP